MENKIDEDSLNEHLKIVDSCYVIEQGEVVKLKNMKYGGKFLKPYQVVPLNEISMVDSNFGNVQIRSQTDQVTLDKSTCSICNDIVKLPGIQCDECTSSICESHYQLLYHKKCPSCRKRMIK